MAGETSVRKNLGGRPRTEQYRKQIMRYSKIEDTFAKIIEKMENEEDKKLVENALEKLKK